MVWPFSSKRSQAKATTSFAALDEAESWFKAQGIDPQSAMFSSYNEQGLARVSGSTILVGKGRSASGDVGFAIEVTAGRGVVASELIIPPGISSHHKAASMKARAVGRPLLDVLVAMAAAHREEFPQ